MDRYKLTPMQQGMLFDYMQSPEEGYYIQQIVCEFKEPLNAAVMHQVWNDAASQFEILRTRCIHTEQGEICQYFDNDVTFPFIELDLDDIDIGEFLESQRSAAFDPFNDNLYSITVLQSRVSSVMVWSFHHMILDGRSHTMILQDVLGAYNAYISGETYEWGETVEFSNYLRAVASNELNCGFWNSKLSSVETRSLKSGNTEINSSNKPIFHEQSIVFSPQETELIKEFSKRDGFSVNCLFQSAWAFLLKKYGASESVVFGNTRACRHFSGEDFSTTRGLLINTLPFPVSFSDKMSVKDLLEQVKKTQFDMREVEGDSLMDISACLELPSKDLFDSILVFENYNFEESLQKQGGICGGMKVKLREKLNSFTVAGYLGTQFKISINYSLTKYSKKQIELVLAQLKNILLMFSREPSQLLSDIDFISAEDKEMVSEFIGEEGETEEDDNIVEFLENIFEKHRDSIAVECPDLRTISFWRLNQKANKVANYLLSVGCEKGDRIAVCMDMCYELVVVFLATLKAGLVYVPIDVSNTKDRIDFYIEDSGVKYVLTLERFSQNIPDVDVDVISIDREEYVICKQDGENLNRKIYASDIAYILYTSGSTGVPKGVEVYHRGLVSLCMEIRDVLDIRQSDRVLMLTTPSFDVSIYEILMALFCAAVLCVPRWEETLPGSMLADTFAKRKITAVTVTPTAILTTPVLDDFSLRVVVCCGEVCSPDIFKRWAEGQKWNFYNAYGPTEVTIWSTVEKFIQGSEKLPIGTPIKDRLCYVLDEKMRVQPVGVPGELYIGGIGVAKGYLNRPKETKESYIDNPFKENDVLYKTGDLVRFLPDGRLDFIKRIDNQVKIAGIRIELEEIEAIVDEYNLIEKSVVLLDDDHRTVNAYIKTKNDINIDEKALREFLAQKLQKVFIPEIFIKIDDFPRTLSGKIDRVELKKRLDDIVDDKDDNIFSESVLPEVDKQKVLLEWNATDMKLPDCTSVVSLIKDFSTKYPAETAVIHNGISYSYANLEDTSNRIAAFLQAAGIVAGDVIGVFLDKSFEYIAAVYGIMKAGGIFVPFATNWPQGRVEFVVEDAGCKVLLTSDSNLKSPALTHFGSLLQPIEDAAACSAYASVNIPEHRDVPAYIIYTSGSTGQPKGVLCSHGSLLNLCTYYKNRLSLTPRDCSAMIANTSFDASIADIWPYLSVGATVSVPTDKKITMDFSKLLNWFIETNVTVAFIPTVLAEMFFSAPDLQNLPLRYLLTGGDTLHSYPPEDYPCEVINTYGPTENTVDSTWYTLGSAEKGRPPIGKPIGNVRAYILNKEQQAVAIGDKGELCLAGNQLALCYLNQPEQTAEKFVDFEFNVLGKTVKEKVYRTGDVASWTDAGDIEFHGRVDNQVQVCGVRIELGEIEGHMLHYPGVMEAAVLPVYEGNTIHMLSGFYSVADENSFDEAGLLEHLKKNLLEVLVPKSLVRLSSLPHTSAGKIDRNSLKIPEYIKHENNEIDFRNEMEKKLLPIWQDVLNYPMLTPEDNFFDVGGHSILILKLVLAVNTRLNMDIDVSTLMQAPTVRKLAESLKNKKSSYAARYSVDIKSSGDNIPVFCVAGIGGGSHWFRSFKKFLSEEQPFYCLEFMGLPEDILRGSIEGVSAEFIKAIKDIQPNGPYIIGGFSDGGCVSYEIVNQLRHAGEKILMFYMIDAYGPNIDRRFISRIKNYVKHFIGLSFAEKKNFFREKYEWRKYQFKNKFSHKEVRKDYDDIWELISMQHRTILNYKYQPMDEIIELFRAEKPPRSMPLDPEAGWTGLANKGINVHYTPGDHYSIFKPPYDKVFVENFEKLIQSKNQEARNLDFSVE